MAFTNQSNVEHRLQIVFGIQPLDPTVENLIGRADALIENFVGYRIEEHAVTERFQGDGYLSAYTPKQPVVTMTSVTESGTLLVDGTDYRMNLVTGRITRLYGTDATYPRLWRSGIENITIVYQAGFATVPSIIESVATDIVTREFYDGAQNAEAAVQAGSVPGITSREVIGEYEVSYRAGTLRGGEPVLTNDDKSQLRRFQRQAFA
jgi:hypothetical protein